MKFLPLVSVAALAITLASCAGDNDKKTSELPYNDPGSWVIMYYADADCDLEEYIMKDINELEVINNSSKQITIIALIDRIPVILPGMETGQTPAPSRSDMIPPI
jgi:hypothetical protein